MLELKLKDLDKKEEWQKAEVKTPDFNWEKMIAKTKEEPVWLHLGAGNIFRGFIAKIGQELLEKGLMESGMIAGDTFDFEVIEKIYKPYDNLTMLVGLNPDGSTEKEIIASVADSISVDVERAEEMEKLKRIFCKDSLQFVSFTITEKGYALMDMEGRVFDFVARDLEEGPAHAKHAMCIVTGMLYERYLAGECPIAMVSMDNCSHNGDKLKQAVLYIAEKWVEKGFMKEGFLTYLKDESKVTFPWSMIDKITPRPAKEIQEMLQEKGIVGMEPVHTSKNTFIAPFVNAEIPQYLVIEDKFPNGRPPLEKAGVYLSDRETVNKTETMKVTTCLNPLHTTLAVYGCTLGYTSIWEEMKDVQLKKLIEKLGYEEGMPVVVNPGILDPMDFIKEVIEVRLPNPFIPDMPQRIATDTSQKVGIRFGETIKSYVRGENLDPSTLKYIPMALAGWCRYLLGIDDKGEEMPVSNDPMLEELQSCLTGIKVGDQKSYDGQLKPILSNSGLFGIDLYEVGLGSKIEEMFIEMIEGPGAVRRFLEKNVG